MAYRDILLVLEKGADKASAYALSLAGLDKAHVTAVTVSNEPAPPGYLYGEIARDYFTIMRAQAAEESNALTARFSDAARIAGVNAETLAITGSSGTAERDFAGLARHFDLTVIQQADPAEPRRDGILEAALFDAGRPMIVVPYIHAAPARFETVMVAWDGSRPAARAIGDAMPLLKQAGRVELVTVANGRHKPEVDLPGFNIARHLARHGVSVELKRLTNAGDIGNTLLSYAADAATDLLVMGGFGHSRFREFVIGGTTRTILETMTLPVLFSH